VCLTTCWGEVFGSEERCQMASDSFSSPVLLLNIHHTSNLLGSITKRRLHLTPRQLVQLRGCSGLLLSNHSSARNTAHRGFWKRRSIVPDHDTVLHNRGAIILLKHGRDTPPPITTCSRGLPLISTSIEHEYRKKRVAEQDCIHNARGILETEKEGFAGGVSIFFLSKF
jgi:hypothetical protein